MQIAPSRDSRTRAIRGNTNALTFDVQVSGECVSASETWTLTREGIFGRDRTVETVLENGVLSFRLNTSWSPTTTHGALHANGRRYEGTVEMETSCGWKYVTFVATAR